MKRNEREKFLKLMGIELVYIYIVGVRVGIGVGLNINTKQKNKKNKVEVSNILSCPLQFVEKWFSFLVEKQNNFVSNWKQNKWNNRHSDTVIH